MEWGLPAHVLRRCDQHAGFPWAGVRASRYPVHPGRRPRALGHERRATVPQHHRVVNGSGSFSGSLRPHWMQPPLLFSVSFALFACVCVVLQMRLRSPRYHIPRLCGIAVFACVVDGTVARDFYLKNPTRLAENFV